MSEKPILFNERMVRAILEGRKTQTRRLIRKKYGNTVLEMKTDKYGTRLIEIMKDEEGVTFGKNEDGSTWRKIRPYIEPQPAYRLGDILYVRETWNYGTVDSDYKEYEPPECWFEEEDWRNDGKFKYEICRYWYLADDEDKQAMKELGGKWRPSIHMPKEAARIWLRVTGIECQQVQDISEEDAQAEGFYRGWQLTEKSSMAMTAKQAFMWLWDTTTDPNDDEGKWLFNPWVWAYRFERIEKP